jgi:hypothetical protein
MNNSAKLLRFSLLAGALYFAAVALVHTFGVKVPGLFIYFNVPSNAYQDQIISFLTFGWAALFYVASISPATNRNSVLAVLISSVVAIFGLVRINAFSDFQALSPDISVSPFWVQTTLLAAYVGWLVVLFIKTRLIDEAV